VIALVEQAPVGRRHRDDAGHLLGVDRLPEYGVDATALRGARLRVGSARDRYGPDADRRGDGDGPLQEIPAAVRHRRHGCLPRGLV